MSWMYKVTETDQHAAPSTLPLEWLLCKSVWYRNMYMDAAYNSRRAFYIHSQIGKKFVFPG